MSGVLWVLFRRSNRAPASQTACALLLLVALLASSLPRSVAAQGAPTATAAPSASLRASPTSVRPGQSVTVSWTQSAPSGSDWISLHPVADDDRNSGYLAWQYANAASGSLSFTAPDKPGRYEFRFFRNGPRLAKSNAFEVAAPVTVTPSPTATRVPTITPTVTPSRTPEPHTPTPTQGSAPQAASPDINRDGRVDGADLELLRADYGQTGTNLRSDLNGDGKVDLFDYNILVRLISQSITSTPTSPTPTSAPTTPTVTRTPTPAVDQYVVYSTPGPVTGAACRNEGPKPVWHTLTFEAQVRLDRDTDGRIAAQLGGGGNTGTNKWVVAVVGGRLRVETWGRPGTGSVVFWTDQRVNDGSPHDVAFTYDDAQGEPAIWVDGALAAITLRENGRVADGRWDDQPTTLELGCGEGGNRIAGELRNVRISSIVRPNLARQPESPWATEPLGLSACDGRQGVYLYAGGTCVRILASYRDLAPEGWADRSELEVEVTGDYQAEPWDGSDYAGVSKGRLRPGTGRHGVGGNVSSIQVWRGPDAEVAPNFVGGSESLVRCGPGYYFASCSANGEYGDGPEDTAWRGADGDLGTQWSSLEREKSYWQASFQSPVNVAQVSIWGRGGGDTLAGRLEFSDGSAADFGGLESNGCRRSISFASRATTFIRFQVTGVGNRNTTGFRELEAHAYRKYPDGGDPACARPGEGGTPVTAEPKVGNVFGLRKGTEIRTGPGFGYARTIPEVPWGGVVPEDNWLVLITDGPVCADGWEWWDTSRKVVDPEGGTGWAALRQKACQPAGGNPPAGNQPGGTNLPPTGEQPRATPLLIAGGAIERKWRALGGESGHLGPVTVSEQDAKQSPHGTSGAYAAFRGGHIHWSETTGPHETHGEVDAKYLEMGGSWGWLGFPVSDVYQWNGSQRADFEGGSVVWDGSKATVLLHPAIVEWARFRDVLRRAVSGDVELLSARFVIPSSFSPNVYVVLPAFDETIQGSTPATTCDDGLTTHPEVSVPSGYKLYRGCISTRDVLTRVIGTYLFDTVLGTVTDELIEALSDKRNWWVSE